jgi:hypothetical protein
VLAAATFVTLAALVAALRRLPAGKRSFDFAQDDGKDAKSLFDKRLLTEKAKPLSQFWEWGLG